MTLLILALLACTSTKPMASAPVVIDLGAIPAESTPALPAIWQIYRDDAGLEDFYRPAPTSPAVASL